MNIPLNIDWQQILLHLFNFTLLAGGLYFLLYKPVKDFMEKRLAYYTGLEEEAAKKLEEASRIEKEYQTRLDQIDTEISEKKEQAAKETEERMSAALEEARKQKEKIIAEAHTIAQKEKKKMLLEAKEDIVKLALAATKKMLNNEEGSCE
ncbi:MAG: ATP synthase F0 subunit B [Lachnospiraceae bacterium]|nr:ATP synthase F0 subunit B [Lachnospiraceae bacterium]